MNEWEYYDAVMDWEDGVKYDRPIQDGEDREVWMIHTIGPEYRYRGDREQSFFGTTYHQLMRKGWRAQRDALKRVPLEEYVAPPIFL